MSNKTEKLCDWIVILAVIATTVGMIFLVGCARVNGFSSISDGVASSDQMRAAATVARNEAATLDELANQADDSSARLIGFAQSAADTLGAPAAVATGLGLLGGLFIPTPGTRKREKELVEAVKK
tara:strand:- start:136 stop:510 length:375 start_codon:yes stop_codon:yes gene_type:complete